MNQSLVSRALTRALLLAFVVIALFPLVIMWMTSLKDQGELVNNTFGLPTVWQFSNYAEAWEQGGIGEAMKTSFVVVSVTMVAAVALSILAGYAFASFDFVGKRALFVFMLVSIMLPVEAMLIPLYYYLGDLGVGDSYLALIIPYTALSLGFGTFWMRTVFQAVPRELRDAAAVDGCGPLRTLWYLMIPVSRSAIGTLAALFFMWNWNEFLLALVLVQDPDLRTVPLALASFQGRFTTNVPLLTAAAAIVTAPVLIMYALLSRRFVEGLAAGAVKG